MNASDLFLQKTKKLLFEKIGISIPVVKSTYGEVAALIGAASVVK